MLAWWPEEKALRAIGHECGVRYWGAAFVDAKRDFAERQEGDRAGDVLIDALRLTPNLASWIEAIRPRARAIDAARARFNKGLGSGAVADLYRHLGAESQLKLYREFFDPITERRELEVVERLPFKGRQALGKGKAAELLLYRATLALDGLVFPSDNAMLDAVVTWTPKERVEHLRSRMAASRSCDEAYKLCVATQALFSTENLDTLCGWAADHWSLSRLKIRRDRAGRYLLGQGRREIVFINVTPDLMFPLSELRHELP
jgi:hypothetical protein